MRAPRTAVRRWVWSVVIAVGLAGSLWVATDRPGPVEHPRDAVAAPVHAIASVRPSRAPDLPAVLVVGVALALAAVWLLARRPAPRPVPVPVRVARGRGPPRSTSS